MSAPRPQRPLDPAIVAAREREDIVVGNEIVRHNRSSRLIHWTVALTFFVSVFTGMPIWTPVFGWMAHLFGGLTVARVIHPWAGVAFTIASIFMFFQWISDMRLEPNEKDWLGPKALQYMRYETNDSEVGKYNRGQNIYFWSSGLGAQSLLVTCLLMWVPRAFPPILMQLAYILHDVTFIVFAVGIVFHIYLGTAAEPGTFGSMIRGTVTRQWARLHHARWYHEVISGEKDRRR